MHRILIVGSVPLAAPWNGADKNFARMLVEHDPANRFLVRTSPHETWPEHVRALRSRYAGAMPTTGQKLLAFSDILRFTHRADLLHIVASLSAPNRLGVALVHQWPRLRGLPVVHTVPSIGDHAVDPRRFPGDVTVVVSEQTRRTLLDHGVRNVLRVFPPLDVEALVPKTAPHLVAQALQLGPHAILYPAHYGSHSGIAEAIQALAGLPPALADAVLVVAGRTHRGQNPAEEAARVTALAVSAGVGDRVRVVGQVADMHALVVACAVTALVPSRLASKMDFPLVVLESLALGRPVILSDVPPLDEALLGGGLSVPYGDVPALSRAFATLLEDATQRRTFAEAGRCAVLARCNPALVVRRYHEIYDLAAGLAASRMAQMAGTGNIQ